MKSDRTVWTLVGVMSAAVWLGTCLQASRGQQPASAPNPAPALTPPSVAKFASPRETLKTLYFSIIAYDFCPSLIDDAVACLEGESDKACAFADAARLAVELDAILRELCLPVNAVPDCPAKNEVAVHDADGFTIKLRRQADGQWRFARETVDQIPAMYRLSLVRHRDLDAQRANLREDFTDPSATMRRFMVDTMTGDYYSAAQALDLSRLAVDQRSEQGPALAQQLMFVIQRRGWIFFQEIPNNPEGLPYTWHADRNGRIVIERVHLSDGKDAWRFSKNTVRNLDKMYAAALQVPPDPRYVLLDKVVPPLPAGATGPVVQCPPSVPPHLKTPRALLKGFFRVMEEAESNDSKLVQALEYFDLEAMPAADRQALGTKLASKLDAVLRKLEVDLASVPDSWNAPPQVLGSRQGLSVELLRQRDGTWRFSRNTVEQVPQLVEKLAAQEKADRSRSGHLESARDTMVFFLNAVNHEQDERAARCLDLDGVHTSARDAVGPVLAVKLKYVIDRIGRVYPQEVPDEPEGPRYVFSSGDLARIVIARKTEGPAKGKWLFTEETVEQIEPMFLAVVGHPVDESLRNASFHLRKPTAWLTPGIWLRLHLPGWARVSAGKLELYQWVGLGLTLFVSWGVALLWLTGLRGGVCWMLHKGGSVLSVRFVACRLRPLTYVATCWLFFKLPEWLDLPVSWLNTIMPARTFLMAGLLGWLGLRVIDLLMAIYTNSELLRPHRNLSDMIVPVCQRLLKGVVFLMVTTYVIYHVGRGESLLRFFTGLGAAGLAASLAAQDILKSFFGTLLLIGERSFKLGDRIKVADNEGIVEQVGFRSTRLRTPDGSVLTIPNSTLASTSIDNQGTPTGKRHSVSVALGKEIPVEQIASLRDRLQAWLREHPAVHADDADVTIGLHRDAGVELQVNFVLQNTPDADEAAARQEITYAVLRMVQAVQKPTLSSYQTELQRAS